MAPISPALSTQPRLLVCFDLREDAVEPEGCSPPVHFLSNCRRILSHARQKGWTVVHVHRRDGQKGVSSPSAYGLGPLPSEPVFLQKGLSAFSNPMFRDLARRFDRGDLIIIGCSSASSCLTTALAAYDQNLKVTLIDDALASTQLEAQGLDAVSALTRSVAAPFVNVARTTDLLVDHRRLKLVHSQ